MDSDGLLTYINSIIFLSADSSSFPTAIEIIAPSDKAPFENIDFVSFISKRKAGNKSNLLFTIANELISAKVTGIE